MESSNKEHFATASGSLLLVLVGLLAIACLASACALEPGAIEPPPSAGIDITLTPIREFGGGTMAPLTKNGARQQLGYAAAVAASGGSVFVVDSTVPGLVRIDAARNDVLLMQRLEDAGTSGLYVTTDLIVYVVDRANRAVLELSESGWERRVFADTLLIPAPVDVTKMNWGATVLIADELTQRLATFDSMAGHTGMLTPTLSPVTVAASINAIAATNQFVFVLDSASREVTQLDFYGRPVGTYGEDALLAPVAMAVDECQRVFVADGHPDGLFVSSPDSYGISSRAAVPGEIAPAVTDLWIDGSELYVAAGTFGVHVLAIDPPCLGL